MIRECQQSDTKDLFDFFKSANKACEIKEWNETLCRASKVLVYIEDDQIRGLGYTTLSTNEADEKSAQFRVLVKPQFRKRGIGTALYTTLEKDVTREKPNFLSAYINDEIESSVPFYEKMGFHKWWGSPDLYYDGGLVPESEVEFTAYEVFFDQFVKVNQDCYYSLQKSNDLKPYIATPEIIKKYKLSNQENVYLALDNDQLMASVTIGQGEIDNLVVAPNYQGMGLGRKALQFGMNQLLKQGHKEIRICYMENNTTAENLYYSMGFKFLKLTHVYRKFL